MVEIAELYLEQYRLINTKQLQSMKSTSLWTIKIIDIVLDERQSPKDDSG